MIYPDVIQLKSAVDKYVQTNYKDHVSFCKFLQGFALFIFSFRVFCFCFFLFIFKIFLLIYFISALYENRTFTSWHFARKPTRTFSALRDFFGISEFARTRTVFASFCKFLQVFASSCKVSLYLFFYFVFFVFVFLVYF